MNSLPIPELLEESRQEAMNRMIAKAQGLGANAIVGIRFSTSNIAQGASELFVYGTAVRVTPLRQPSPRSISNTGLSHGKLSFPTADLCGAL